MVLLQLGWVPEGHWLDVADLLDDTYLAVEVDNDLGDHVESTHEVSGVVPILDHVL